jgi:DNA adenine methylase
LSNVILRYPGGKGRFANILANNVLSTGIRTLIEPFAGGGAAGLTLLKNGVIDKLVLVELDARVAAFWKKLESDSNFAKQVEQFKYASKEPNTKDDDELEKRRQILADELSKLEKSDLGMWTLVKNRCSFGGYLDGGLLVKGFGRPSQGPYEYYEGVGSQWNGKNLSLKISRVHEQFKQGKIVFVEGDAFIELLKYPNAFAFIDPPYTHGKNSPGKGLYKENDINHIKLFELLSSRKSPWLATYNNCEEVRKLARQFGFQYKKVKMSRLHANTDKDNQETYKEIIVCPTNQNLILEDNVGRPRGSKNKEVSLSSTSLPPSVQKIMEAISIAKALPVEDKEWFKSQIE